MKARIRTVKPEAFTDEALWDLEQDTGLPIFRAFTGLWCHADREGRFEWRPRPLKAGILPYWEGDFSRVLDALATRGLVVKYTVDGREYGHIPSFTKHQAINAREEESKLPAPNGTSSNFENLHACNTRDSRDDDASITRHDLARVERNGTEGNGTEHASRRERVEEPREARDHEQPSTLPGSFSRAVKIPIALRCRLALERKDLADHAVVQEWPEILEASGVLAPAMRIGSLRFAAFSKDSNLRAVAEILASGFSIEELRRAAAKIPNHEWLQDKRKLSALTVPLLNELLSEEKSSFRRENSQDGPPPVTPEAAAAKIRADRAFEAKRLRELGVTPESARETHPGASNRATIEALEARLG